MLNAIVFVCGAALMSLEIVAARVLAPDAEVSGPEPLRRISTSIDGRSQVPGLSKMGVDLYSGMVQLGDVPVMTDAYAPTDSLITLQ